MYVINVVDPTKINVDRLYKCNKFIRDWLIYQKHMSPFGQADDGNWYFARTQKLGEVLKELPLYLKLVDNLNKKVYNPNEKS